VIEIGDGESPDCQRALRAMYLFLDKELTQEQKDHVQGHLDECLPCLESFEFEAELKQVISCKCQEAVPAHLYERVRMSLAREFDKETAIANNDAIWPVGERNSDGDNGDEEGIPPV